MIRLSGTHTCRRCGKEYTWKDMVLEHNEVPSGYKLDDMVRNANSATLIPATGLYTVEVSCPYCGCFEWEEAKPE